MDSNIRLVQQSLLSAKSKMVIARELGDQRMEDQALCAGYRSLGELVINTPALREVVLSYLNSGGAR
ncbi:hypothetical protein MQY53_004421 [Salmonella enterica subsp. enterica]|nr:hypothetical protein [Salmonella enterica]EIZ8586809.1 hypothetical protein [Salmonella enterica subsp. enterica]